MDKTGTLTETTLTVDRMETPTFASHDARSLASSYVEGAKDESQTMRAIESFLSKKQGVVALDSVAFSSWRRYGGICIPYNDTTICIRAGAPEVFFPYLKDQEEKVWLASLLSQETRAGKHILCIVRSENEGRPSMPEDIAADSLTIVAVFVLENKLRQGIQNAISFFQNRGVVIRILSGDHPETVRAIAAASGIRDTDKLITGDDMVHWSAADYKENVTKYTLFARLKPEQKEKCIVAFKLDGFTAMVGDGANDALSLKKADLSIAMAEGAAATRQVAAIVLTQNSFVELPNGVRLADSMIENIEMFASIFLNQTFIVFLLFAALLVGGFTFPLTPLNISFVNYFTVGLPGLLISYWAITPHGGTRPVSKRPFLERVIPVPLAFAIAQSLAGLAVFLWTLQNGVDVVMPLILFIAVTGYMAFALIPATYQGSSTSQMKMQMLALALFEVVCFYAGVRIHVIQLIYMVATPADTAVLYSLGVSLICGAVMYAMSLYAAFAIKRLYDPAT